MHASQEQSHAGTNQTSGKPGHPSGKQSPDDDPPIRRTRLNLLFPISAGLTFLFILTAMVVANPISHELDGPFVRVMKANGMWVMAIEVVAIIACGIGAMWLESRAAPTAVEQAVIDSPTETSVD
ncbi:MAG: hypothetical protein KDA68_16705 [Planctomycetaceae bacterium]|nr:hypothetical protein [Planctomycetaceae bacterium]